MTIAPCTYRATEDQAGTYVLQFSAKRVEGNYEGLFFTRGGSLGSCAARGALDVSRPHSTRAAHTLLAERLPQGRAGGLADAQAWVLPVPLKVMKNLDVFP